MPIQHVEDKSSADILIHIGGAAGFIVLSVALRALCDCLGFYLEAVKFPSLVAPLQREALVVGALAALTLAIPLRIADHQHLSMLSNLLQLLLLTVGCYLALMGLPVACAAAACAQWEEAENTPPDAARTELSQLDAKVEGRVRRWLRRRALRRAQAFHEVRGYFIVQNGLLQEFPFARYLRDCMAQRLATLVCPTSHWCGWVVVALLIAGRETVIDADA